MKNKLDGETRRPMCKESGKLNDRGDGLDSIEKGEGGEGTTGSK